MYNVSFFSGSDCNLYRSLAPSSDRTRALINKPIISGNNIFCGLHLTHNVINMTDI